MSAPGGCEVPWLDDEEQAAWRGWVAASARVSAAIARDLARAHRLSEPEYAVLVGLSEAPEGTLRMGSLARHLEWSPSRLSHLLSRMEGRGLVRRCGCASDARGAFAVITDAGRAEISAAAPAHVLSVRRHFLDCLDHDQLRQLTAITTALLSDYDGACGGDDGGGE